MYSRSRRQENAANIQELLEVAPTGRIRSTGNASGAPRRGASRESCSFKMTLAKVIERSKVCYVERMLPRQSASEKRCGSIKTSYGRISTICADSLTKISSSGYLRDCVLLASCLKFSCFCEAWFSIYAALLGGTMLPVSGGAVRAWLSIQVAAALSVRIAAQLVALFGRPRRSCRARTGRSFTLFHQKFRRSRGSQPTKLLRSHAFHPSAGALEQAHSLAQDILKERTKSIQREALANKRSSLVRPELL